MLFCFRSFRCSCFSPCLFPFHREMHALKIQWPTFNEHEGWTESKHKNEKIASTITHDYFLLIFCTLFLISTYTHSIVLLMILILFLQTFSRARARSIYSWLHSWIYSRNLPLNLLIICKEWNKWNKLVNYTKSKRRKYKNKRFPYRYFVLQMDKFAFV